jgi:hypothetical protein
MDGWRTRRDETENKISGRWQRGRHRLGVGSGAVQSERVSNSIIALETPINHRRTGGRERAGTVRHDRHIRERCCSRRRIINVKDPCGQTEFGGQFLDWTGTAAGEHWVQTPPLGLHGHKMARIAVGAVNHPRAAVRHSRRTGRLREAAFLAAKGDLVHQAVKRRLEPCRGAVRVSVAERPARIMTQAGRVGT